MNWVDITYYHWFHDCGKPLCLIVGEDGKRSYPNHEIYSARQFLEVYPDNHQVATLIVMDMDFHRLRGDDVTKLWEHDLAPTLYFTAWAEIIANSKMFGGQESTSFKIKKKCLIQAGKKYSN